MWAASERRAGVGMCVATFDASNDAYVAITRVQSIQFKWIQEAQMPAAVHSNGSSICSIFTPANLSNFHVDIAKND